MRAAPAFELTLRLSATERSLVALLVAMVAAALAAWVWSHIDAAAGPAGRGTWPWLAMLPVAAGIGAWSGWTMARPDTCTLRWQGDRWSWIDRGVESEGTVQVRLDFAAWLLLVLRPQPYGAVRWFTVGRRRAGAAWHPLRAALFAPAAIEPGADEGAPT
jgi:hypothetical protein